MRPLAFLLVLLLAGCVAESDPTSSATPSTPLVIEAVALCPGGAPSTASACLGKVGTMGDPDSLGVLRFLNQAILDPRDNQTLLVLAQEASTTLYAGNPRPDPEAPGTDYARSTLLVSSDLGVSWTSVRLPTARLAAEMTGLPGIHDYDGAWDMAFTADGTLHIVGVHQGNLAVGALQPFHAVYHIATRDNGATWDPPVVIADNQGSWGSFPRLAVLPDQSLLVLWAGETTGTHAVRSTDGGLTWPAADVVQTIPGCSGLSRIHLVGDVPTFACWKEGFLGPEGPASVYRVDPDGLAFERVGSPGGEDAEPCQAYRLVAFGEKGLAFVGLACPRHELSVSLDGGAKWSKAVDLADLGEGPGGDELPFAFASDPWGRLHAVVEQSDSQSSDGVLLWPHIVHRVIDPRNLTLVAQSDLVGGDSPHQDCDMGLGYTGASTARNDSAFVTDRMAFLGFSCGAFYFQLQQVGAKP